MLYNGHILEVKCGIFRVMVDLTNIFTYSILSHKCWMLKFGTGNGVLGTVVVVVINFNQTQKFRKSKTYLH